MTVMTQKLRKDIGNDPEYDRCALQELLFILIGSCGGRVTRSHDVYYAAKKVQRKFAIPPICAKHHGVDQFQDAHTEAPQEIRRWVALNRVTDDELLEFPKADFIRDRDRLNKKYGPYIAPPIVGNRSGGINY